VRDRGCTRVLSGGVRNLFHKIVRNGRLHSDKPITSIYCSTTSTFASSCFVKFEGKLSIALWTPKRVFVSSALNLVQGIFRLFSLMIRGAEV
jgi:hypothetical protein